MKTRGHEKAVCLVKARPMPMKKNAKKSKSAKKSEIHDHAKDHLLKNKRNVLQEKTCIASNIIRTESEALMSQDKLPKGLSR